MQTMLWSHPWHSCFNCYSVKQFIVQKQTKLSILYRDT